MRVSRNLCDGPAGGVAPRRRFLTSGIWKSVPSAKWIVRVAPCPSRGSGSNGTENRLKLLHPDETNDSSLRLSSKSPVSGNIGV